ncbi:MAG: class I tRNA ligase family protein, partial [Candidatus Kerfeldbacteria bacterium]|nr:class I tRNA ligase family protein [Candidatus Kerfeldbacteria bacterium]
MAVPNFVELEQDILKRWKDEDVFRATLKKDAPQGKFVFFEGPPTANGKPHMGHVETRAFKDLFPRFKTMQGYRVDRKAGWDTQGLPVELEVEKAIGVSGKQDIERYGIEKFNEQCRTSVWKYKELWEQMTDRVGFWLDLEKPYITYENSYIESLWWIFRQAWDAGLLVQDYKVVPYCPRCGTALSSHEVAQGYEVVKDRSVYVKFELVDEPGTFVLAWTTTPWTLPGNVALAVSEKLSYLKVKTDDGNLIVAEALAERVVGTVDGEKISGKSLVGKKYQPLFDFLDLGK